MDNSETLFGFISEAGNHWSLFIIGAMMAGIFLSLFINMGPSFITLIQTSIHRGFRSAAWFAIGVVLNDTMIIGLCILTSIQAKFVEESGGFTFFAIAAGAVIFFFGLSTFLRKVKAEEEMNVTVKALERQTNEVLEKRKDTPTWIIFCGKGFLLNLLNPFAWIFWFSTVAVAAAELRGSKAGLLVFFGIMMASCLVVELLKAWGASSLKRFFNSRRIRILNKVFGAILMIFGLYFIVFKGLL